MKSILTVLCSVLISSLAYSQFAVVSTQPANNATNVSLNVTVSITFNEALDTNAINNLADGSWFDNLDGLVSWEYSPDLKTSSGTYVLLPNKAYFVAYTYVPALSGASITTPGVFYFTTGSAFPTTTVSGTLSSGTTGVSPEHAIVALSPESLEQSESKPAFQAWANVNSNGTFTIPNVANGTYWPIAAKDVNGDGDIDPENGEDVVALGDSIVVNNVSLTGVELTFVTFTPRSFHESIHIADSLAEQLPADKVLRYVTSWDTDSLGRSRGWEYLYTALSDTKIYRLRVETSFSEIDSASDPFTLQWALSHKPMTGYAAAAQSGVVMTLVENAGGRAFRQAPYPDTLELSVEMRLGDATHDEFGSSVPDTNQFYWSVFYIHGVNYEPWRIDGEKYLCNFTTGAVILSGPLITSVEPAANPTGFSLLQNYPNPFNPVSTIRYSLATREHITLTVFDLLGRHVATLIDGVQEAGLHDVRFDANGLASGVYLYTLRTGSSSESRRLVLLR